MSTPADLNMLLSQMEVLLETVTERLNDASGKEEKLLEAVQHWLAQSEDQSLTEGVRFTYLECAEAVTGIYGSGH